MEYDLATMKAIMENDKFALYILTQIGKTKQYEGIRYDKNTKQQVKVTLVKTEEKYPPYRVIGFPREK